MSNKTDNAADVGHTAGPWRHTCDEYIYDATSGQKLRVSRIDSENGWNDYLNLAYVTNCTIDGAANTRLIAAAPCLLAACEAAKAVLDREGYFGGVVDQLNAAISKARGQ